VRLATRGAIAALAAFILSSVGCGAGGADSELRVADDTPIILISVDTLRSDRLPAYGYDGVETPAIDRLRRDGILFERAYTHVPLTLPAHASLLTGQLPPEHGVRDNLGYTVDSEKTPLLQQVLKEAGYATGAGVSAFVLRRATGIGAGFDLYDDDIEITTDEGHTGVQTIQRPGVETVDAVRPWLRSVADRPFFLFAHFFEPHTPYEPPAEYAARYPSPYDGEVAAADEAVGAILDELRSLGVYDQAFIVFLSDHGEGLGEHGEGEHGLFLYRSTLQVPLIIKLPWAERAGETVADPVQLVDFYPTVVSALGLPPAQDFPGTALFSGSRAEPRENTIYAETFFPRLHFGWSDLAALIVGHYHFIEAPQPELYDLLQDPDEINNLVASEPALATEFRSSLARFDRRLEAPAATDAETRRRLAALGYVGGAVMTDDEDLPDPKSKVDTLEDIQRAYRLYDDRNYEAAALAYRQILEDNPKIEDAWDYLAMSYMALGRPEQAISAHQAAVEQIPNSRRLHLRAAFLLEDAGRLDEAYVHANIAIPYNPPAAHLLLAEIAFKRGDLEGAEIEAREAMSSGDRQAGPRLILADIAIARGEPYEAINLLQQALEEGITDDSVHAKLAITYIWIGDYDSAEEVLEGFEETEDLSLLLAFGKLASSRQRWPEATSWFERALRLDPTNPTIKLNLGLIAMSEDNLGESRRLLEEAVAGNPRSFEAWHTLGMLFARLRDAKGAIRAWERAREIQPGFVPTLYNLGLAYAQDGQLTKAIDYFEDFAARAPDGPQRDEALAMAQRIRQRVAQKR
jgi:arylsulfatase A-like enzyme/Flp pilus assembly protein TadD